MTPGNQPASDMAAFWNSPVADKWVANRAALEALFRPVTARLLDRAALAPGQRVLDVGCGSGGSTIAAARAVAPDGSVVGLDVSETLAADARAQIASNGIDNARIEVGDAATVRLGPFNTVLSRFGLMFFVDPVPAFKNVAANLVGGGRLAFVAWAAMDKNPWFSIPRATAIARFAEPEPTPPRTPGPFAFEDRAYVSDILTRAGFRDVSVTEEAVTLTPEGTLQDVGRLGASLGPASAIADAHEATAKDRRAIAEAIAAAFEEDATDDGVRIPAAINVATARRA